MLGPNFPYRSTEREWLASAEEVVVAAPDDPQAWASLGDQVYHYGRLLGMPDAVERSLRAYQRALVLDSSYLPGWEHLGEAALLAGDSSLARRSIRARLQRDSVSPYAKQDQWLGRRLLGDSALPDVPLASDSLVSTPTSIAWMAVAQGAALADADTVVELTLRRVQGKRDRRRAEFRARNYYLVRGWPTRARRAVAATLDPHLRRDFLILDAIYAGGDSMLARRLVAEAPATFSRPESDDQLPTITLQSVAAQFQLTRGNTEPARRAVRAWLIKPMMPESLLAVYTSDYAARLLDAQLAALDHRPDARARLEELDSLLRDAPTGGDFFERIGNIEAARLWQERGEPGRALASIRRRLEGLQTYSELPQYLRNEGRYAALAGDGKGAIQAYRRYLVLRSDAESALQSQVDTVRAELAAVEADLATR
jgi:tetratricopeptide (TPR) repeat protein